MLKSGCSGWSRRTKNSARSLPQRGQIPKFEGAKDMDSRPPFPPFTPETAVQKVRLAEDGWNSRDAEKVALAYTVDSKWRHRAEFPQGREQIIAFLKRK